MNSLDQRSQAIEARKVPDEKRLQMLPRHLGRHMLTVGSTVYAFIRKLSVRYIGGYWAYLNCRTVDASWHRKVRHRSPSSSKAMDSYVLEHISIPGFSAPLLPSNSQRQFPKNRLIPGLLL
jgi:hypothetical protein